MEAKENQEERIEREESVRGEEDVCRTARCRRPHSSLQKPHTFHYRYLTRPKPHARLYTPSCPPAATGAPAPCPPGPPRS